MVYWLLFIFHAVVMPIAAFHALVYKRDHRAALGWIGIIIFFPIAGPLLYFVFGINRLKSKAKLFSGKHLPFMSFGFERAAIVRKEDYNDPLLSTVPNPYLASIGGRVSGENLCAGNSIEMLLNGEAFFPRLIEHIGQAQHSIFIATYLFSRGGIGAKVIEALCQAAQRQVKVYVLIDGIGAMYSLRAAVKPLKKAGAQVALFMPPTLLPPSFSINMRNHRKIAVVDGRFGYFGGINIDQRHMVEDVSNKEATEDVHFLSSGPLVEQLQAVFSSDWYRATHQQLEIHKNSDVNGQVHCRVIDDGPDENLDYLAMTLNGIFAAAEKEILIMVPYFLPSREMVAVLQAATLSGVRIRVVLPERSNIRMVDWACRNLLWELLTWGVEVYYKPAPFAHSKLIAVDGRYVMAGSANIDARSLRLNFELGVEMIDVPMCEQVKRHIEKVILLCRRVELDELDSRAIWVRARDAFFWLFSSYL